MGFVTIEHRSYRWWRGEPGLCGWSQRGASEANIYLSGHRTESKHDIYQSLENSSWQLTTLSLVQTVTKGLLVP